MRGLSSLTRLFVLYSLALAALGLAGCATLARAQPCVGGQCRPTRIVRQLQPFTPPSSTSPSSTPPTQALRVRIRTTEGEIFTSSAAILEHAGRRLVVTVAHTFLEQPRDGIRRPTDRPLSGTVSIVQVERERAARIVALDRGLDLAALEAPDLDAGWPLAPGIGLQQESRAAGFNATGQFRWLPLRAVARPEPVLITFQGRSESGDSGAAIVDGQNRVAAILWGYRDGLVHAIPADVVADWLDRNFPKSEPEPKPLPPAILPGPVVETTDDDWRPETTRLRTRIDRLESGRDQLVSRVQGLERRANSADDVRETLSRDMADLTRAHGRLTVLLRDRACRCERAQAVAAPQEPQREEPPAANESRGPIVTTIISGAEGWLNAKVVAVLAGLGIPGWIGGALWWFGRRRLKRRVVKSLRRRQAHDEEPDQESLRQVQTRPAEVSVEQSPPLGEPVTKVDRRYVGEPVTGAPRWTDAPPSQVVRTDTRTVLVEGPNHEAKAWDDAVSEVSRREPNLIPLFDKLRAMKNQFLSGTPRK